MTQAHPTALIADDEPLLRNSLTRLLTQAWPELEIVAQARNGREAVEQYHALKPTICFLDVHMPGLSGVEAARQIGRNVHLVFVTAFNDYAVQAFEQGAIDYLVKPVDSARLADTVARIKERLEKAQAAPDMEQLLDRLEQRLSKKNEADSRLNSSEDLNQTPNPLANTNSEPLRWIRAMVGQSLRMIAVNDIDYLRSDEKYTLIAWRGEDGKPLEALIRTSLKELLDQLDAQHFIQVHRSVVVNLNAISHVVRCENETASIHMKGRSEKLPVSRSYLHHFRQM